ncbi:hypothetical protein [Streptomyces kaempferi]|uniref:Uncharacterized protein n=1 Tax=Streptomyces kaempferi TaxID=333725 RepID=A0ABW3XIM8_9ACTN
MTFMQIPWGDMSSAMGAFFAYQRVESALRERHPDLNDRLRMQESVGGRRATALTVTVDDDTKTLLWMTRFGRPYDYRLFWHIYGPADGGTPRIWDPQTGEDVLADAFHERTTAWRDRREEVSPWKWDEPEMYQIVRLADALAERGIPVAQVVANNRLRATLAPKGWEARSFRQHDGDFLVVQNGPRTVRVSCKPTLGWIVDVHDLEHGVQWRLDLNNLIHGQASLTPGTPLPDIDTTRLANVIEELLDHPFVFAPGPEAVTKIETLGNNGSERLTLCSKEVVPPSPHVLVTEVVAQLRSMGFTDMELSSSDGSPFSSGGVHVVWWERSKDLGTSDVKQLYADATVEGKRLVVVINGGITRPATDFANRAKAFIFHLYRDSGRVRPANKLAQEASFTNEYGPAPHV